MGFYLKFWLVILCLLFVLLFYKFLIAFKLNCCWFFSSVFLICWFTHGYCSVTQLYPTLCDPMNHAACWTSLSFTISQSFLKLMTFESVMPSNHLILCHPLLLPSIFPSIRVFSNEWAFRIRWPKYSSFSFSISPSKEYSGLISFRMTGWISLQSKGLSRVFSNTVVQKHQFFDTQPSLWSNSHIHTWLLEKPSLWLEEFL